MARYSPTPTEDYGGPPGDPYGGGGHGGQGAYGGQHGGQQGAYGGHPGDYGGQGGRGAGVDSYPQQYTHANDHSQPFTNQVGGAGSSVKRMQATHILDYIFFAAAIVLAVGGMIGHVVELFQPNFMAAINMLYIMLLGLVLAILDTPFVKSLKLISETKGLIGKYCSFLTRLTGQGVMFLFLGSTLLASTFANQTSILTRVCTIITNSFVIIVGILAIVLGIMKSQKLRKAQQHLGQGALEQHYDNFAKEYPRRTFGEQSGLTQQEFSDLTYANGGLGWEEIDLKQVFNALASTPAWKVPQAAQDGQNAVPNDPKLTMEDLKRWVNGGWVFL